MIVPFTPEEVAFAADTGRYLTGQSVARYSNAAARTAAITSPVLNQLTMLDDRPGVVQYWDGTVWADATSGSGGDDGVASAWVGPDAPPGPPETGDIWYDSDDPNLFPLPLVVASGGTGATTPAAARTNLGVNLPLAIADGGTGGTTAPTARSSLGVPTAGNSTTTAGAPTTGTWARGDTWLDSANTLWTCTTGGTPGTWAPPVGYELAYNQITTVVNVTVTTVASPQIVIEGTTRTYDGSPVLVEFYATVVVAPTGSTIFLNLWDGATDLGIVGQVYLTSAVPALGSTLHGRRRLVPSAGAHNYRLLGWLASGTGGAVYAAAGGAGQTHNPAFLRVTRA